MNQNNQLVLRILIVLVMLIGGVSAIMAFGGINSVIGNGKLYTITFSMIFYGITGTICLALTRKKEYRSLGFAGLGISIAAFVLNVITVLSNQSFMDVYQLAFTLTIASIALAQISFLYYINIQNKFASMARIAAVIFIAVFSFLVIIRVFGNIESFAALYGSDSYFRFVLAALILDLTATLLVPLCNRLQITEKIELLNEPEKANSNLIEP